MTGIALELSGQALDPDRCPRIKADGKQCGNRAGHRTDHVGVGWCWKHAGNTSAGKVHGAKLAALAAMPALGGEIDVNPLDALLYCVRRASGMAAYFRVRAEAAALAGQPLDVDTRLEREALGDLAKWSKMAVDAGVAERQVRLAERMGERLAALLEDAFSGVELDEGVRSHVVGRFAAGLAQLEQGVIEGKGEDA